MLAKGRARRASAMLLVAGVVAAGAAGAAPAGAKVVAATAAHGKIGFFPTPAYAKALQTSCTTSCSLMTFHSGGVVQHGEKQYLIFWAPSGFYMPSSYKTALSQWVTDFGVSDYGPSTDFSVAQQYYDLTGPGATKSFVPYALSNGGIIADTAAYPANGCTDSDNSVTLPKCLNDGQIRTEIQRLVTALHLPQDQNTDYALLTPHNVGSCFTSSSTSCAYTQYCGYQSFFPSAGDQLDSTTLHWTSTVQRCRA